MPIWLRRYTFNVIKEYYEKQNEEYEKATNKPKTITSTSKIAKPPTTTPTYTTKASKK